MAKNRARRLILAAIAITIAVAFWQSPPPAVAAGTWRVGKDTEFKPAKNYDDLPADSPFRLALTITDPSYVYVFSHSVVDGTLLLWPTPAIDSDLPDLLTAGTYVLPGYSEGKELAWNTRSQVQPLTTVVAIASSQRLPELDALLPQVRQWTNSVFPDRSMLVTKPTAGDEPVGGPKSAEFASALLRAAASATITATQPNGPMIPLPGHEDIWCLGWRFKETKPR